MNKEQELIVPISSDECGASGGEVDSDEDIVTHYPQVFNSTTGELIMLPTTNPNIRPPSGPLPTISVTPHSPATAPKTYAVLEDSLQQVRELHESIQHMRNATAASITYTLNPLLAQVARLSASCPALNEAAQEPELLSGSLGSSPLHQPPSRKGSGALDWLTQPDIHRRKSWTALDDLSNTGKVKHTRQRSISLSSMESEAEESSLIDNVDGSTVRLLGPDAPVIIRHRTRASTGGASTHSLNEADLQNDFNKLKAKREAEQLRLLPQRLPLQKSVSTPSIIAVRELASEPTFAGCQPAIPTGRPSGTESETEEEGSRSSRAHYDVHFKEDLHNIPYDSHSEKRRKRGSLFFRKKKDKSKKLMHQWISACYSNAHICDICSKALNNTLALYCETCGATVHQNSCKDGIQECVSTKMKNNKCTSRLSGFSAPSGKNQSAKRSFTSGSNSISTSRRSQLCYSPWRRVATKLGVNQILCDYKDNDLHHSHHDPTSFADDIVLIQSEFLADTTITAADLCSDLSLGLHEIETDSWTPHVGKEISKKLKEKEVKRQEHIYEFILTEKHHCMTLLVMQKIFVDGLHKYFNLGPDVEKMFPRLNDLIQIHLGLLSRLRQRQREHLVVSSIADILLEQFSNVHASKLKSAYGEFCSRHRDAVEIYKYYFQKDARFGQFIKHCQTNPLLKKKGIPECILFVTQRLTKYPLLIEPLIKTSKENRQEQEALQKALALVKEILIEVDSQVAEKEKEDRKLEIYNRIDAKSITIHRGHKFRKSDILQGNRSLKFEGVAMLMQGRGKMQVVLVIVLSDVLFFLQENSHKYTFFTPDSKAGVVSLQKLLVREKAGQDSRGIYLISSNPSDPEMFELKVHKPKDKQVWIHAIREAVQNCPEDDENVNMSNEDKQGILNAKQHQVRNLIEADSDIEALLRQNDIEQALLLEEKMSLQLRLLATSGLEPPPPPSYRHLVSDSADTGQMWKEVLATVQEVSQLASSLYATGTNLSRSVSSAGEHQSETYVSPILPKRAETFGGFDNNQVLIKGTGKKLVQSGSGNPPIYISELENLKPGDLKMVDRLNSRNFLSLGKSVANGGAENCENNLTHQLRMQQQQQQQTIQQNIQSTNLQQLGGISNEIPALLSLGREQQYAAINLSHYVYTLLCIISQLMTTNGSLQAQLNNVKGVDKQYRHNQQLEELRNLQDKLSAEKASWTIVKEQEEKELEEKRQQILKMQEKIKADQNDITQQRDQLYRKMEILTNQGLLISPNVPIPVSTQLDDSSKDSSEDSSPQSSDTSQSSATSAAGSTQSSFSYHTSGGDKRKDTKWTKNSNQSKQLPLNLISATNQQKVSQNLPVKQQIPLKLASRLSTGGSGSGSGGSGGNSDSSKSNSGGGPQQILPLKLSQAGYQRLSENSFSPPDETIPASFSHTRTGSSPAMMQQSSPQSASSSSASPYNQYQTSSSAKDTYPTNKIRNKDQPQVAKDEEVIYF